MGKWSLSPSSPTGWQSFRSRLASLALVWTRFSAAVGWSPIMESSWPLVAPSDIAKAKPTDLTWKAVWATRKQLVISSCDKLSEVRFENDTRSTIIVTQRVYDEVCVIYWAKIFFSVLKHLGRIMALQAQGCNWNKKMDQWFRSYNTFNKDESIKGMLKECFLHFTISFFVCL